MKVTTLLIVLSLYTSSLFAQDFASSFLQKYGDKEMEVVSLGKQMLSMLAAMSNKNTEVMEAIQGLESIKIVSLDSKEKVGKQYQYAQDMLYKKNSGFVEMMTIKEGDENTLIMTKEEDGIITDFVLITANKTSFNLIGLSGKVNLSTLSKLSSSMQFEKLKKIDSINQASTNKNK